MDTQPRRSSRVASVMTNALGKNVLFVSILALSFCGCTRHTSESATTSDTIDQRQGQNSKTEIPPTDIAQTPPPAPQTSDAVSAPVEQQRISNPTANSKSGATAIIPDAPDMRGPADRTMETRTHWDNAGRYFFEYPAQWQVFEASDKVVITAVPSNGGVVSVDFHSPGHGIVPSAYGFKDSAAGVCNVYMRDAVQNGRPTRGPLDLKIPGAADAAWAAWEWNGNVTEFVVFRVDGEYKKLEFHYLSTAVNFREQALTALQTLRIKNGDVRLTNRPVPGSTPQESPRERQNRTETSQFASSLLSRPSPVQDGANEPIRNAKPFLGVSMDDLVFKTPHGEGVLVLGIVEGSPSADAKLKVGDVILEVDKATTKSREDVQRIVENLQNGDPYEIVVARGQKRLKMEFIPKGTPANAAMLQLHMPIASQCKGHEGPVLSVKLLPKSTRAVSAGADHTLRHWELLDASSESGAKELNVVRGHRDAVNCLAVSPNGKLIASGSSDRDVRIWDTDTWKEMKRLSGHAASVLSVSFGLDGKTLISSSEDGTLRSWNIETGDVINVFNGHKEPVRCCAVSPDGVSMLSGGDDGTLRVWNLTTGDETHQLKEKIGKVNAVTFSPDGSLALSGSGDEHVIGGLNGIIVTENGRRRTELVPGNFKGYGLACLWDISSGRIIRRFEGHLFPVRSVAFSPNGKFLLTGAGAGAPKLRSWAQWLPDRGFVSDDKIRLWEVESGHEVNRFCAHMKAVRSLEMAPSGNYFVSAGGDNVVNVWNLTE